MADFIAELRPKVEKAQENIWTIFVDGLASRSDSDWILLSQTGQRIEHTIHFGFATKNIEAEYEAFITKIRIVNTIGSMNIKIYIDSWLIARQIKGEFIPKEDNMARYKAKTMVALQTFQTWEIFHINKCDNVDANALAYLGVVSSPKEGRWVQVENQST